jgi:hypothetical protein
MSPPKTPEPVRRIEITETQARLAIDGVKRLPLRMIDPEWQAAVRLVGLITDAFTARPAPPPPEPKAEAAAAPG